MTGHSGLNRGEHSTVVSSFLAVCLPPPREKRTATPLQLFLLYVSQSGNGGDNRQQLPEAFPDALLLLATQLNPCNSVKSLLSTFPTVEMLSSGDRLLRGLKWSGEELLSAFPIVEIPLPYHPQRARTSASRAVYSHAQSPRRLFRSC